MVLFFWPPMKEMQEETSDSIAMLLETLRSMHLSMFSVTRGHGSDCLYK